MVIMQTLLNYELNEKESFGEVFEKNKNETKHTEEDDGKNL
jgi:hypothetical protein